MSRRNGEPLEASRLIAFSDGVFAVVITLLVLDIHVPAGRIAFRELLKEQSPNYLMFVVAFLMVGIKWLNHHRLFALIRRVDTVLNILNLLLLLGICLVPFTTALIAKYMTSPEAALASVAYGSVWTINGFLYTAILVYARQTGFVDKSAVNRGLVWLYLIGPLAYLVAIAASFLNIYAGIAIYLIVVSLYIPPQRVRPASREDQ